MGLRNFLALAVILLLVRRNDAIATKAKLEVVRSHNNFRANTSPEAADMLNMTWYEPASKTAQFWASSCVRLKHDESSARKDKKWGSCGQNIYISSAQSTWAAAVKAWHSEVSLFTYGSEANKFSDIGHYTQVVWAKTHKVGCGYAKCKDARGTFYNYVCNYCPAGNMQGQINTPYKKGTKCSGCPDTCLPSKLCPAKLKT